MFHTLQETLIHYASRPAGLPMVNDIIRNKEKKSARKDERRVVYSAVTARARKELISMRGSVGVDGLERTVDAEAGVTNDLLDLTVSLKVVESLAGKAAVDLETIDKGGDSDQTVGLDILLKLVVGGLVEDDGVLGLVLDCIGC